jgi:acyl-coenzyme A synthetase/AMP-(fatty) acid ligase
VEVTSAEPLRFRIVGRVGDWVNVGGAKVNPREVEAVLGTHPEIHQARVYPRANSVTGHILCADLVCDGAPPAERAMRELAASRLQAHKIPRLIRFVERIDQTRTAKVSRL